MSVVHTEYGWKDAHPTCAHEDILLAVRKYIQTIYHDKPVKILGSVAETGMWLQGLMNLGIM